MSKKSYFAGVGLRPADPFSEERDIQYFKIVVKWMQASEKVLKGSPRVLLFGISTGFWLRPESRFDFPHSFFQRNTHAHTSIVVFSSSKN